MDFYSQEGQGVGGDQMDPLGTASKAAAQQSGEGNTGEPVIGKLPKTSGTNAKKEKKPMSTKMKVGLGVGGIIVAAGILSVLGGNQEPVAPKIAPHPPAPNAAAADASAGMMGAHANGEATTVMGGDGAANAAAANAPASPGAQAPGPGGTGTASTTLAPAPQPQPAAVASPAPSNADVAAPGQLAASANQVANAGGGDKPKAGSDVAQQSPASAEDSSKLAERVADLERKLAKLEQSKATRAPAASNSSGGEDRPAPQKKQQTAPKKLVSAANKASGKPVSSQVAVPVAAAPMPKEVPLEVRVLGTTTRQGEISALISVGGANQRVAEGQMIPGIGVVSKIGADAAGAPYIEANGVKYQ